MGVCVRSGEWAGGFRPLVDDEGKVLLIFSLKRFVDVAGVGHG